MDSDTPLDYAMFQLSPRRSRCELIVSGDGKTEKLASGFLKPFTAHLKVAEEQASQAVSSIKLEVERRKNGRTWFNKGTLERFVRFVSTPEVLELVNTFDAEMSQLEGARRIYSQGAGDPPSGTLGEHETAAAAAADITKKELLRAIDMRLVAVKQDLTTACARASSAGFTLDNVPELLLFADHFGARRLNEACTKFVSLCQRRPELVSRQHTPPSLPSQWKGFDEGNVRASSGSDMSIDEPEVEPSGGKLPGNVGGGLKLPQSGNSQQPHLSTAELPAASHQLKPIPRRFVDIQAEKATEEPPAASVAEPAQQDVGGGSRRLSVQDRINLFESKRKEQAGSSNNSTSGGVNKVAAGKGVHRRFPSDVSVEKSVLRRWSGASDMSIDLNSGTNSNCSERKESGSAAGTPTSVNFQAQCIGKTEEKEASGLKDTATSHFCLDLKECQPATSSSSSSSLPSSQAQIKAFPKDRDRTKDEGTATSSTQSGPVLEKDREICQKNVSMGRVENHGLSDQASCQTLVKASSESGGGAGWKEHAAICAQYKAISEEHVKDEAALQIPTRAVSAVAEQVGWENQEVSWSQPGEVPSGADSAGAKDQPNTVTQFRTFVRKTEGIEVKPKGPSNSRFPFKSSSGKTEGISPESDLLTPQPQCRTFPGKLEEAGVKVAAASQVPFGSVPTKPKEGSGPQGTNLHQQSSAPNQIRKLQGQRYERAYDEGNAVPVFPGKRAKESMEIFDSPSTSSMEQVQVVRPSKGNQELNDELQMKANQLEKLFAAHKLRVQSDQMAASRRSKPADVQVDHAPKSVEKKAAVALLKQLAESNSSNGIDFDANLLLKRVDNQDFGTNIKQKLDSLGPSDDSRGKLYKRYMQKRDAKLREEWGSKRAQKEAKMKAMHDSLERNQSEMRAKFAGSAAAQELANSHHRAEKLRSFNARSALKNKDQAVASLPGEDGDFQEPYEQVDYGQDKTYSDNLFGDGSSKSNNSRKLPSSKSLSSSTPRTSAASFLKSSAKATNTCSVKRRTQPENPLAQSVPNFSDLRKENTKPSAGISRANTRVQSRNFSRSKSNCEEVNLVKEDKPRRSQSMRKPSVGPCELKDLSPLNSDSASLTPLRISKEQTEPVFLNKVQKNGESKSFLGKGNGLGPGAGAGVAKVNASRVSEVLKDGEDFEGMVDQREDSPDMVKDDEELERTSAEENPDATDFPADSDSEKPRLSQEFGNSDDPVSEDGNVPRSFSQVDDDMSAVSTKFNTFAGNVQESPGESPGSWNSHIQHSFSYANETSDVDASVDSPTGSPASWNSHPLNQRMEADAARMRKKWGSTQIPMLVANASQQPRKDVTKGFKRLLKFGRKSRGVESLITDWVSASTASEGDDDTEDGRDLATRPSDDLRKSRMGYPLSAYDGFNEGEVFPEQAHSLRSSIPNAPANFKLREDHLTGSSLKAPRSFFSLSTFRSKGSESKLR
ncbi:uncharacterized protein LOC103714814 isoform X2 [Phoenix dactylifera]|uniref:Uncharacterized protein LOC103714814 isoform X2 n=1 Tax=Phoenix dactylifera TaxID=42345 RepID=A0A8B7CJF6_PHODC|nr:uncharacterized protein LOC103714814 isoform X2 [Phoenix dactylifera]